MWNLTGGWAVALVLAIAGIGTACPWQSTNLGTVTDSAELIVVADFSNAVLTPERDPLTGGSNPKRTAQLRIREVVKGKSSSEVIVVKLPVPGMGFSDPEFYRSGGRVIALLTVDKDDGRYYPAFGYFGIRRPAGDGELGVIVARIREWISIGNIRSAEERERRTIEWLVLCIESPVTRFDGFDELCVGWAVSDHEQWKRAKRRSQLTRGQRTRLLAAIEADAGSSFVEWSRLLVGLDDERAEPLAWKELTSRGTEFGVADFMRMYSGPAQLNWGTRMADQASASADPAQRRALFREFLAEYNDGILNSE